MLQPFVWASRRDLPATEADLLHLVFGQHAVVLHRLSVVDPHGRSGSTLTHCLIGPADQMGPSLAAGLQKWYGWFLDPDALPADGRLLPVAVDRLHAVAVEARQDLRQRLSEQPPAEFAALVAALLDDPAARLAIVDPIVPAGLLIAGLIGLTAGLLAGPLTFSTREDKDLRPGQPRIIAADARLAAALSGAGFRRVVAGSSGTEEEQLAAQLVAVYLMEDGPDRLAELRPAQPMRSRPAVRTWLADIRIAPGVLGPFSSVLHRAAGNASSPDEVQYLRSPSGQAAVQRELQTTQPDVLTQWATDQPSGMSHSGTLLPVQNELLQRLFHQALRGINFESIANTIRASRVDRARIMRAMAEAYKRAREEGISTTATVALMSAASRAGSSRADLYQYVQSMLSVHEPAEVLRMAAERAPHQPDVAWLLLEGAPRINLRRRGQKEIQRVLDENGWFVRQIADLEPNEAYARNMFMGLLRLSTGGALIRSLDHLRRIFDVLPHWSAAFLAAIFYSTESEARTYVRDLLAEQYLLDKNLQIVPQAPPEEQSGAAGFFGSLFRKVSATSEPPPTEPEPRETVRPPRPSPRPSGAPPRRPETESSP